MTGLPTLSIVIPCFNARRFVGDAIGSVLDQADDGVEVIVVDDGSGDGSAAFVDEEFGKRVRVLRQRNAGVASARNTGFEASSGELVAWLDADDRLVPDTLRLRRGMFRADPRLEMLAGQVEVVNEDSHEAYISPQRCDADYLKRDLLARTNLPHLDVLTFRRSAITRLGRYDATLRIVDDFDMWLRAWSLLRWRFVAAVLAVQRWGSYPSLSRSETKTFIYDQVGRALRKNRELVSSATGSDVHWRAGYARFAADFALIHLNLGDRRAARPWAVTATTMAPIRTEWRAYRYLLESILPPQLYAAGRATVARLRPRRSTPCTDPRSTW
jgi:glycosyltransferase involved in cell wall biosynthesis